MQTKRQDKNRNLATNTNYKIKFDFTDTTVASSGRTDLVNYLKKVTDISGLYLSYLIIGDSTSTIATDNCGAYTPTSSNLYGGVHIVIMVTFKNEPLSSVFTTSDTCKRDSSTNNPILGLLTFNIALIQTVTDNYDFKQHTKMTTQEIIRIFGFRLDQLKEWIDPTSTSTPKASYGTAKVDTSMIYKDTLRGFVDTIFLKTPFTSQTAKDYYNCNTAQGFQLENQENLKLSKAKLDFERTILYNEALTASVLDGDSVFSIFTGALLKDMGYFNYIDFNFLDDITFGKGKGCDFITKVCQSTTDYAEFNRSSDQYCDFYGQGIGENIVDSFVDPGCTIPKLSKKNLCEQSSFTNIVTREIGGQSSRCFNSKAIQLLQSSPAINVRCHEIICSDNYQTISIRLLKSQQALPICTINQQGKKVKLQDFTSSLSDVTTGELLCPSNYKDFCLTPSRCLNHCSQNGFCIRGNCVCQQGYAGLDCAQSCTGPTPYWDGTQCVAACPINQYINPNHSCLHTCPEGYYIDLSSGACKQCYYTCRTCSGSTSSNCLSCNYPYTLDVTGTKCELKCNSLCITCFGTASNQCFSCISGYYLSGTECKQCVSPCSTCSSDVNCSSCISTNYSYDSTNKKCNPICHSSCLSCSEPANSSKCLTCAAGKYLSSGSCLTCASSCLTCQSAADYCTACINTTQFDLFNNKCYPKCKTNCSLCSTYAVCDQCFLKYYYNTSTSQCTLCSTPNCLSCDNLNKCLDCAKGYSLNTATNSCIALPADPNFNQYNCLTSQSTPIYKCLSCSTGYFLQNNECAPCSTSCYTCTGESTKCTSCPNKTYLVAGQFRCEYQCHISCLTCSAGMDSTKCTQCQPGYVLNGASPNSCQACSSPCKTCYGQSNICQSCIADYTLVGTVCQPNCDSSCQTCTLPNNSSACSSCPAQFYLNSTQQCLPCTSPCFNCSNSATECYSCIPNYSLVGTQCQPNCHSSCLTCDVPNSSTNCLSCRDGYYLTNSKQCQPCDITTAKCSTCVAMNNYCTSCQANYSLVGSSCVPICHEKCAQCTQPLQLSSCTVCKDGYFKNASTCDPCKSPCYQCNTTENTCTSCVSGYSLDTATSTCKPSCKSPCLTCSQPNNENACTSCIDFYFLPANSNTCQKCGTNCVNCENIPENCKICDNPASPSPQIYNIVNGICVTICDSNCRECVSGYKYKCTSCQNGLYLDSVTSTCKNCNSPCKLCSTATDCLTCVNNYEFDAATLKCLPTCDSSCKLHQCSKPNDIDNCTACNPNYFLKVATNSATGITTKNCLQCKFPCQECTGSETNCTVCPTKYKMYLTTCIPDCGNNCKTCTDPFNSNTCTECDSGYYLSITGTGSATTRQCLLCASPCKTCTEKADTCTSCNSNYTINGNVCLPNCHLSCKSCLLPNQSSSCKSCNSGYYLTATGSCVACTSPCLSCEINTNNCLSCITNYQLYPKQPNQNECRPICHSSCSTCKSPNNDQQCQSCVDGRYLSLIDVDSGKCLVCKDECSTCSSLNICLGCNPNYTFNAATSQCLPSNCHRTCQTCSLSYNDKACTSCYSDSWFNALTQTCTYCKFPCKTCSGSSTNCTSCTNNYSLALQSDGTSICTPICDPSCLTCSLPFNSSACLSCRTPNYVLNSNNQCVSCISSCTSCKNTANNCQSCITGYQLESLYPNDPTSLIKTCGLVCNKECTKCQGYPSYCTACIDGYVLDTNYKICKLVCHSSCYSCNYSNSSVSCTSCWPGDYLKDNTCIPCKKGTYSDFDKCTNCLDNCIECSNSNFCITCRAGYHLDSNKSSCIKNEIETIIVTTDCNYSCATCVDSKYTSCVTCAANRQLQKYLFTSIGECICPPSFTDKGQSQCEFTSTQESIITTNTAMYASSLSASIILGTIASNPVIFVGLVEISQNLSFLTYVNFQSKVGLDQNMQALYSSHITSILNFKSIAPSKSNTPLTTKQFRSLETTDNNVMLSEVDTGVSPSELEYVGNDKLYQNDKTPYFAVNSLSIVVITIISWILNLCFSKFGLKDQFNWKSKLRNFFYKSFPLVFFLLTFQEMSLLIFFQFDNFNFNTSLDGFSSIFAIFVLIYEIGVIGFLVYILEIKGIFKNQIVEVIDGQGQTNAAPSNNSINSQNSNLNKNIKLQIKEQSVVPLQIVEFLPQSEENKGDSILEFRQKYWILGEFLSHETLIKRIFIFVILIRKFIVSIIQVTTYNHPVLQVSLLFIFYLIYFIYLIISRPFKNTRHSICYIFCELIILIIHILMIALVSTSESNVQQQTDISLAILSLTILLMCSYILISLVTLIFTIHQYCVKKDKQIGSSSTLTKTPTVSTSSLYKRSKNILTQLENNQKTQPNEKGLSPSYELYKNLPNESVVSQSKYTNAVNDSVLQIDETQQEIEQSIQFNQQLNMKKIALNKLDSQSLRNSIIFNTRQFDINNKNNSFERVVLLDDTSNLFHFIAPRERFQIQPVFSELFDE